MNDKIKINLQMAGAAYPLTINREDEEIVREAAKQVNIRINAYREHYQNISSERIIAMVAYQFALETLQLKDRNDTEPYTAKIKELTEVLEAYFREEQENDFLSVFYERNNVAHCTKVLSCNGQAFMQCFLFIYFKKQINKMTVVTIVVSIACFIVGGFASYMFFKHGLKSKYDSILKEAETEAEVIKKNKLLEVKEKFLNKKADLEKEVSLRNQKIQQAENKLKQRELVLNQRQEEIQRKKLEAEAVKENLEAQLAIVDKKKEELEHMQRQEIEKLEAISGLSAEEAKERMVESLKEEAKTQAQSYINDIMDDAKLTASKEAKRIVIQSIQRVATETAIENSVTVFHIESDEIKGRIIGREGRNIRALEAATGVEIVVDDTPEAIVLSAFDPVRREIARLALHQLVTDGRIHPARIEEVVAKVRKQVEEEIIETGKRTTIDLGIHGLHPELIRIIGKMKYRSSYGQNLLQHARETANLCAVMASELGLNPKKAKRAGLLHDIGKVPDEEPELPHALYGMKLAEKFKEKPDICNAIGAHHDEVEMTSLLAPIVQVCDAISGARPGARREIVEAYIKRLNDLEQLAMSYPGVTKTYAIQAGRELRVIVGADKIDDKATENLSGEIAKKIQDEMTYPGQVKITVIRETRAVSYAK